MSEDVQRLLRRADADLIDEWGDAHGAKWLPIPSTDQRLGWLASVYPDLALNQQKVLARLAFEADLIADLGQPSRDWIFRDVAHSFPNLAKQGFQKRNAESRALWLWLNDRQAFDWADRRQQVFDKTGKPRLCNRYECLPNPDFFISDTKLGPFTDALSALYKDHDYSGEHLIPQIDWELCEDGTRRAMSLHVAISRLGSLEPTIDDNGKLDDILLRRPTNWRCRYELHSGRIDLICDRGGQKLRNESADAFVGLVLGQGEPPSAVEAPSIDLMAFTEPGAMPAIEGLSEWRVTEVTLIHGDNPGETFTIASDADAWSAATRLTDEPVGELGPYRVQKIKVNAIFEAGTGSAGRAERTIGLEIFEDGRMTFKKTGNRQQLVKSALEDMLAGLG